MASGVAFAIVTADPLDLLAAVAAVTDDAHGAVVTFAGVVRDHDGGRAVAALGYEAHPSAGDAMAAVADAVAARHPHVRIAAAHRVGELAIGDAALVCAVSSAHRGEAFAACADLVDDIKSGVPIWKHQRFADGTAEWVGAHG